MVLRRANELALRGNRQLVHFLAVVDHGSLGRSAEALNISVQALSKSIQVLEDIVGAKLFDRGSRGLELTVFGESLLGHARAVIAELRRAAQELEEIKGTEIGHVHIGTGPTFAATLLPLVVGRLIKVSPGLRVSVTEGRHALFPMVLHGELDLAIVALDVSVPDPELGQEVILENDVVPVVRKTHPLALLESPTLEDLQSAAWLLAKSPDPYRSRLAETFSKAGLHPPRPLIEYESASFARGMLLAADVVAFMPTALVQAEVESGELVALKNCGLGIRSPIGFVFRRRASQSPACRLFIKQLRELGEAM